MRVQRSQNILPINRLRQSIAKATILLTQQIAFNSSKLARFRKKTAHRGPKTRPQGTKYSLVEAAARRLPGLDCSVRVAWLLLRGETCAIAARKKRCDARLADNSSSTRKESRSGATDAIRRSNAANESKPSRLHARSLAGFDNPAIPLRRVFDVRQTAGGSRVKNQAV